MSDLDIAVEGILDEDGDVESVHKRGHKTAQCNKYRT